MPEAKFPGGKCQLQDIILTRCQHRNLLHTLRGVTVFIHQASIVDGGSHHGESFQFEGLVQVSNGFQHSPRAQAVRDKGESVQACKATGDICGQQSPALDCLIALERIIDKGQPSRISRPKHTYENAVAAELKPLIPTGKAADTVPAVHVKAVRAEENVAALNRLCQFAVERARRIGIGLRVRTNRLHH